MQRRMRLHLQTHLANCPVFGRVDALPQVVATPTWPHPSALETYVTTAMITPTTDMNPQNERECIEAGIDHLIACVQCTGTDESSGPVAKTPHEEASGKPNSSELTSSTVLAKRHERAPRRSVFECTSNIDAHHTTILDYRVARHDREPEQSSNSASVKRKPSQEHSLARCTEVKKHLNDIRMQEFLDKWNST